MTQRGDAESLGYVAPQAKRGTLGAPLLPYNVGAGRVLVDAASYVVSQVNPDERLTESPVGPTTFVRVDVRFFVPTT